MNFACVLPTSALLGECPRWDEQRQVLWWVDINAPALHRFDPASGADTAIAMPENIGCFALAEGGGFIAGLRSGVWRLDDDGKPVELLAANPEDPRTSRFNDGRCDPAGRFLAGTLDEPKAGGNAHLYRLDGTTLEAISGGLLTSNGLAFSPDGQWLYHSDTPNFAIYRYPYDPATGAVGARETWVRVTPVPGDRGRPDGAAVDAEGYYWSAFYEGARVVRFAPDGTVDSTYPLPARCPTMCAFGGTDLRTLYVTTARGGRSVEELAQYPQSGGVFAMRAPVAGLPEARWRRY
jgi:sugar lactone lactonase YvrE